MSAPKNYQTDAVVIKKTKLGEADRILSLYSPQLGKIQAVAKGVRRSRSKMAGHLELLTHSLISLVRGRNIDTITGTQTINSFVPLKTDIRLTSHALYAIELVDQFTADHIENQHLFQLLLGTLKTLCLKNTKELLLRYFELHLLDEVGYRPQLQQCVSCRRNLEPTTNLFSYSDGGILCPNCRYCQSTPYPLSLNALKVLRFLQDSDFTTANRLILDYELSCELETVMRGYITHLLEHEVKSFGWLKELRGRLKEGN